MSVAVRAALAGLLVAACAPSQPYFWTKPGATEEQFRKVSRACRFDALKGVGPAARGVCTVVPGRGQICREYDEFERAREEDERARKVQSAYAECMQGRGWASNHEGVGFEQNYGRKSKGEEKEKENSPDAGDGDESSQG